MTTQETLKENNDSLLEGLEKLPAKSFLFKLDKIVDHKKLTQAELDGINNLKRDEFYRQSVITFLNFNYNPEVIKLLSDALGEKSFEAIKMLSKNSNSYENLTDEEKLDLYKLICLIDGTVSYYDDYNKSKNQIDKENYELCKSNLELKIKAIEANPKTLSKNVESYEEKMEYIKESLENSAATEDEKKLLISLIEGAEKDKQIFEIVYNIVKNYKEKKLLKIEGEVENLIKEILEEISRYLSSEPQRMLNFIEKLHLPMDKKDIFRSFALSTLLPAVGISMAVDPMSVNAFYNSNKLQKLIKDKIKSDTKLAKDTANKITKELSKIFFEIK